VCMHGWDRIVKWLRHQPGNLKVLGPILVWPLWCRCCFLDQESLLTLLQSIQLFKWEPGGLMSTGEAARLIVISQHLEAGSTGKHTHTHTHTHMHYTNTHIHHITKRYTKQSKSKAYGSHAEHSYCRPVNQHWDACAPLRFLSLVQANLPRAG